MTPRPFATARLTSYRNVAMRSNTEAVFAASLDRFGLAWMYEPKRFGSSPETWLPDFEIEADAQGRPVYIEVKAGLAGREIEGPHAGHVERLKARLAIAWFSEPDAVLIVAEKGWAYHEANPQLVSLWVGQFDGASPWWQLGAFMGCRICGAVSVCVLDTFACRRCGSNVAALLWPFSSPDQA